MKEEEKKQLQNFIDTNNMKSISDFVRKTILEKIKIEDLTKKDQNLQDVNIPDYIPKNKYVVFVNGAIVGVGDSPSEVSLIAVQKFPNLPFFIEFNGVKKDKKIEYCFMSFSDFQGWKYSRLYAYSYPILPLNISHKEGKALINASIDTASTLCLLKNNLIPKRNFEKNRTQDIYTAGGIITGEIYSTHIELLNTTFIVEFIFAPISDELPFQFLIGRNLLDELDAFFFGKKQIFLLRKAEA
jgi:hypothetical protein